MPFCPNCGAQVDDAANFCPGCGQKLTATVQSTVQPAAAVPTATAAGDDSVLLISLGTCTRAAAQELIGDLCGYSDEEAATLINALPVPVAQNLTAQQAQYLAQALTEYGMEASVYDGNGYCAMSANTSVFNDDGSIVAAAATALGMLCASNRIQREYMRRWDYPYRFDGPRPPLFRYSYNRPPVHVRRFLFTPPPPPRRPAPPPPRGGGLLGSLLGLGGKPPRPNHPPAPPRRHPGPSGGPPPNRRPGGPASPGGHGPFHTDGPSRGPGGGGHGNGGNRGGGGFGGSGGRGGHR